MRASVVINTYNRAASLPTTLEALKLQTFAEFPVRQKPASFSLERVLEKLQAAGTDA